MKLLWLPAAIGDLDAIFDYYVISSPRAATLLYNKILDEVEILRTNPCIAPKEPLLDNGLCEYRSLVVAKGKYKVIYTILEKKSVLIVLLFACRQNPAVLRKMTFSRKT
jgi:plasmid stabilization system protein ParE